MSNQQPVFPAAWQFYAPVVATLGAVITALNAWLGTAEGGAQKWISVAISAVTAALIWLRARAKKVGVTVDVPDTPDAAAS
jgi:hypothetical protein